MTQLLTVEEAARRLALRPKTLRNWISLRRIATVKFGSRRAGAVRIETAELERLIAAHRQPAEKPWGESWDVGRLLEARWTRRPGTVG